MDKDKWLAQLQAIEDEKYRIAKLLEQETAELVAKIKARGDICYFYTCQKCRREFVREEACDIVLNQSPICRFCEEEEQKRIEREKKEKEWEDALSTGNIGV